MNRTSRIKTVEYKSEIKKLDEHTLQEQERVVVTAEEINEIGHDPNFDFLDIETRQALCHELDAAKLELLRASNQNDRMLDQTKSARREINSELCETVRATEHEKRRTEKAVEKGRDAKTGVAPLEQAVEIMGEANSENRLLQSGLEDDQKVVDRESQEYERRIREAME